MGRNGENKKAHRLVPSRMWIEAWLANLMSKNNVNPARSDSQPDTKPRIELDAEARLAIHEAVENRVEKRVQQLEENYTRQAKVFFGAVGVVVGIALIALAFIGVTTWNDAKEKFLNSTDVARRTREITELQSESATILTQMQATFSAYTNRLAELKTLDDIVTSRDLKNNLGSVETKLQAVDKVLADSQKTLKELKDAYDFNSTLSDAFNDSRVAFDRLKQIASDTKNPFTEKAKYAVETIVMNYSQSYLTASGSQYRWPEGTDVQKTTMNDVMTELKTTSRISLPDLIDFVWLSPNFSKSQKMNFMMKIVREGKSSIAVVTAGYRIKEEAGLLPLPALSHDQYEAWWDKNKDKYKE